MPDSPKAEFDYLAQRSRSLHRHSYVLPVACWIVERGGSSITAAEALVGLEGRVERKRVLEALSRLSEIGALNELPREERKNAPRFFEQVANPYWQLVEACLAESREQAENSSSRESALEDPR